MEQIFMPAERNNSDFKTEYIRKSGKTLAQIFGVDILSVKDNNVSVLDLGVRPANCLGRGKIETIGNLLSLTVDELCDIRNMGAKSVDEIIQKLNLYTLNPDNILKTDAYKEDSNTHKSDSERNEKFKAVVEAVLTNESYSLNGLKDNQLQRIEKMKKAVDVFGEETCMNMYLNSEYGLDIIRSFNTFANENLEIYNYTQKIENTVSTLNDCIKKRRLVPFIQLYRLNHEELPNELLLNCKEETTVIQLSTIFQRSVSGENVKEQNAKIVKFIKWLSFDPEELAKSMSESFYAAIEKKNQRSLDVVLLRVNGETLESLGERYGITRERVRQIENKAYAMCFKGCNAFAYEPIMLAYALKDGCEMICYETLCEFFEEKFACVLWNTVKTLKNSKFTKAYHYSDALEAIIIDDVISPKNNQALIENVDAALADLPPVFEQSQKQPLLRLLSEKNFMSVAVLDRMFCKTYKHTNRFYHKGAITVPFMCEYVLKHKFPLGFKTGDALEAEKFRGYLAELFGEKGKNISNRALDAKIGVVGVLCARGKYIHPDFLQVDESIIGKINDYIENSPRQLMMYGELFEALKEDFHGTQIADRYWLQGALKKYGCKFYKGRDYVSKTQNISFVDELEAFVEEHGIVHKSELFDEFPSLSEARLGQVVDRSTTVFNIDKGYYIHASQFDIRQEDYCVLRKYLSQACKDVPVSIRSVYKAAFEKAPDFMKRNSFGDPDELFAALKYMFPDEFIFSHRYVAKLGEEGATNKSVILRHVENADSINVEELLNICEQNDIRILSVEHLCRSLSPEYLRISSTKLIKRELTGADDEAVNKTVAFLQEKLRDAGYIVGHGFCGYSKLPNLKTQWNEFILESVVLLSGKVNVIRLLRSSENRTNSIYVSDRYKDDSYSSFLTKVMNERTLNGRFSSEDEMKEWLIKKGLIESNLPKALEENKHLYIKRNSF